MCRATQGTGSGVPPQLIFVYGFTTVERAPGKIGNPVKFSSISSENSAPAQQMGQQMQQSHVNGAYGAPPAGAYGQPPAGAYGQPPASAYGQPQAGMSNPVHQQQQQAPMAANSMYGAHPAPAYGQPASQQSGTGNQVRHLPATSLQLNGLDAFITQKQRVWSSHCGHSSQSEVHITKGHSPAVNLCCSSVFQHLLCAADKCFRPSLGCPTAGLPQICSVSSQRIHIMPGEQP